MNCTTTITNEEYLDVDVDSIINNPMQPRIYINNEELLDLTNSIKENGLIQPISLIKTHNGQFILKTGQRRWIAHKNLGLKTIKAIVEIETNETINNKSLFEIAVMENVQRDSLNPLEFALSIRQAMDMNLYKNIDEISRAIGKSKSYISKVMKVLHLNDEIIKDLSINRPTNDIEALYEIQKIPDLRKQKEVYKDFVDKKLDRKSLRELVKNKSSHAKQKSSYSLKVTKRRIDLGIELKDLSSEKKSKIEKEIKSLLEKHLFF